MWRVVRTSSWSKLLQCRFFSASSSRYAVEYEGDWSYSSEWWRDHESDSGRTVFRSHSNVGNGDVSVVAYPSSRPGLEEWETTEKWLQEKYTKDHPEFKDDGGKFSVLGYQWRVLHFNDSTRQSTVKVMAAYKRCAHQPGSIYLMQQPHCLAVPYLKSMISTGLSTLASSCYDLLSAVQGNRPLHVLCIGHGGGSIPLFMSTNIPGAIVHSVEIDPVVLSASIGAMGFPSLALGRNLREKEEDNDVLWENIDGRLLIFNSDAEKFVQVSATMYDLVFVDAYDGDDVFSRKLWNPDCPFLKALGSRVHPEHGTVVINLHGDSDVLGGNYSHHQKSGSLPIGKYVSNVSRAYKEELGLAFALSVPWLCNVTVVACRGLKDGRRTLTSGGKDSIMNALISGSEFVENVMDLPFSCNEYINRDFVVFD